MPLSSKIFTRLERIDFCCEFCFPHITGQAKAVDLPAPQNKKGVPQAANFRFEDTLRTQKNNGGWGPSMKPEQKNPRWEAAGPLLASNPVVERVWEDFMEDKNGLNMDIFSPPVKRLGILYNTFPHHVNNLCWTSYRFIFLYWGSPSEASIRGFWKSRWRLRRHRIEAGDSK